ncbi:hypothetical protein K474DRAFT_1597520 [Panus rudis PR-1116 ss-1]|nr:hypothetical protein K474DRAFT_1597520 [Panus rudis PR-1116 ss-1]
MSDAATLLNVTVSHVSPMLSYVPHSLWWDETNLNSNIQENYSLKSCHATDASLGQGSVSLQWYGQGGTVYGGYRQRLGSFNVTLDNTTNSFLGFKDGDAEILPDVLFTASNLTLGHHLVTLTNTGSSERNATLDIDRVSAIRRW